MLRTAWRTFRRSVLQRAGHRAEHADPPSPTAPAPAADPQRDARIAAADAVIVSFPKSGRTWLRMLVVRALAARHGIPLVDDTKAGALPGDAIDPTDLEGLAARVPGLPRLDVVHDDRPQVKTPDELDGDRSAFAGKRVVLLARDPRDVIVSWWHWVQHGRAKGITTEAGDLPGFVRQRRGSLETLLTYHAQWWAARSVPAAFELIRYEDLHADPVPTLRRALDTLVPGHGCGDEHLAAAAEASRFDRMQAMELGGGVRRLPGTPADPPDARKARRGEVGSHRDELPPGTIAWANARIAALLDPGFGVPLPLACEVPDADGVLVSFPKSGRTWVRMMLGHLLSERVRAAGGQPPDDPFDLEALAASAAQHGLPRLAVTHDDQPHRRAPAHLQPDKAAYAGKRVVLLVRHPGDVFTSLFHWQRHRRMSVEPAASVGELIRRAAGGLASWATFHRYWLAARDVPAAFTLVRYEDLHADPARELRRVCDGLGIEGVSDDAIAAAVEAAAFERMRALEVSGASEHLPGRADDPADARKVRQGKVGGWRDELSDEDAGWLTERAGGVLDALGYGSDPPPAGRG